ncbi:MAG: glycoside hydrolase family 3 C-terminal domain-containing protein [Lachnospiraceae bacterium]|nr:glycoside hydrolase family 3 C-terminal domain-containing protein [Lachnospiraceae bacterium]
MELTENQVLLEEYRAQAKELVDQMTLEEKVSQTLYRAPAIERLGIPAYNWWNEALHGVARAGTATIFPQSIGLAATFDEDFIETVADAISTEGRAKFNMQARLEDRDIYKGLTFWAPNINIFRDPRWGRGHETFGEDPYLTSRLGLRFVKGLQGHDEKYLKAAACAKHFAVHSGPEALRHQFDARVSKQDLYETYLPAFRTCVKEGHVEAVMGAYNRFNGAPCCGNRELLQDILRKEWGFQGHVVSDCWAIQDFHMWHNVTQTPVESAAMAMNNGCDLNCGDMFANLLLAVQDGRVDETRLDEALISLFTTRMKLGILTEEAENPFDEIPYSVVDSVQMRKLNLEAAEKCVVLLKNEGHLLPLKKENIKTVGIIGPNADNRRALVGNYEGTASRYVTVLEGIQDYLGEECRVLYSQGCGLSAQSDPILRTGKERLAEVREICALSDVVIACLGLDAGLEGEEGDTGNEFASGDKPDLNLPGFQEEVLRIVSDSGKPAVLILLSGSALAINFADAHIPAILQGWYPGAQGGRAIANILFGEVNPQGKLPITFYRSAEELPEFTDYSMEGRTYRYMKQDALYPFGYGLSYTDFAYTEASLSAKRITEEGMDVEVTVENAGNMAGTETVQVYIKAIPKEEKPHVPNAQLKGICKCALEPGEKKRVSIHLPVEAFALYDEAGRRMVHEGEYRVYIGGQGPDKRSRELTGKTVIELPVFAEKTMEL